MTSIIGPEILQRIGNTPLQELSSYSTENIKFYAKLEWYNPFGSVKDRAAYWMIKDAEKKGSLVKDKSIIIEPTSGNTGIALAGIASSMGIKSKSLFLRKLAQKLKESLETLAQHFMKLQTIYAHVWERGPIKALRLLLPLQNLDPIFIICQINMKMIPIFLPIMRVLVLKFGNNRMER